MTLGESSNPDSYMAAKTVNPVVNRDMIDVYRDPLTFDLDDDTFLLYAQTLKRETDDWWAQHGNAGVNLSSRRQLNETYFFGRQLQGVKMKKYQIKVQDNILWEAYKYLRAMALSKLPDITVNPGMDTDEAKQFADMLSKVVTGDIQSRERKRTLGTAFNHLPVYFTGVIKGFWNPQKGKYGDYDFRAVLPENLTLDYRSGSNDPRDMDFIFETVEYTVKELVMMFPKKEKDLYMQLNKEGTFAVGDGKPNENNEKGLNTKIKIQELWFKWYDRPKTKEGQSDEWEQIVGVAWYYKGVLFDKIKHPYWDWSGTPQTFTYQLKEVGDNLFKKEKQPVDEQLLRQSLLAGQPLENSQTETLFHNHLDYPEFPYIFMGANQWGKTPLDETSDIEQAQPLQENYDNRLQQLNSIIARSRGKHVFSSESGVTKDDVSNMDMSDPDQDILIAGDVTKMHAFIPGEQPSPALLADAANSRERIFDKLGVHAATRGQADSDTAATNNQIAREGDFNRMDDLVDDTINYAAEKMANWIMQFIKLFYTEQHLRRILGPNGKWVTVKLHRDLLDDGMEVVIGASGSDKLKAAQQAMDMAKIKLIDPYRFYKDTGSSDPRGRTIALMNFLMAPQMYLQDVKAGGDGSGTMAVSSAAGVVEGNIQGQGQSPQALQDIMQIEQGQIPPTPTQLDPAYMGTFSQFMQSPEVEELIAKYGPQFKDQLLQFAQAVSALSQQSVQQGQPQPGEQVGAPGAPVGPVTQNPQPGNTSQVAALPPTG